MTPYIIILVIIFLVLVFAQEAPIIKTIVEKSRIDNYYLLDYSRQEDDSDIKIAGKTVKERADDDAKELEELEFHRELGNLAKARKLGALLSDKIVNIDKEPLPDSVILDEDYKMQRRLLFAFAAYYSVEKNLLNKILQRVTINVFYDALHKSVPEFYDDLGESGSFSFYYLCVRRGGDIDSCIGHTFAMLVGKEDDESTEKLGMTLFYHFVDIVADQIKALELVLPAERQNK